MKTATLLHNPGAGEEAHTKDAISSLIESEGFTCRYTSVKETSWDIINEETDLIIIAGGDGTVRTVAGKILSGKITNQPLFALLPLGTANNIAKTLGLTGTTEEIIRSWKKMNTKSVNVWNIQNLPEADFFIEGFGLGVFPQLIKEMKGHNQEISDTTEMKLKAAMKVLYSIIQTYEAADCVITADGMEYTGKFLLVEIMNICSVGPNLHLAPYADPGDGMLEIVLVSEDQKESFSDYILSKINGTNQIFRGTTLKAKSVQIRYEGNLIHADDELIESKESREISIHLENRLLNFLVP